MKTTPELRQQIRERANAHENEFNPAHVLALLDDLADARRTTLEEARQVARKARQGHAIQRETANQIELGIRALLNDSEKATCNNYDPIGTVTGPDGEHVDKRDCYVCGGTEAQHRRGES